MCHIKGQDKTPEIQWNEVEIGNLPEKQFRIMIVKVNGGKDWEHAGNVYQRPRRTKGQTEVNNTLEGINSRITEAENR